MTAKKHRSGKSMANLKLLNNSPFPPTPERSDRSTLVKQVSDAINENPHKFLRGGESNSTPMRPFKNKLDKHGQSNLYDDPDMEYFTESQD